MPWVENSVTGQSVRPSVRDQPLIPREKILSGRSAGRRVGQRLTKKAFPSMCLTEVITEDDRSFDYQQSNNRNDQHCERRDSYKNIVAWLADFPVAEV